MAKKQQKDKKNQIIHAAIKVFAEQGFHNTRLDDVAKKAEVAKGTLYLYFKSKEDLFMHCLLDGSEKNTENAQKIIQSNESFKERLKRLVLLQADTFAHNGTLIQQFIQRGSCFPDNSETSALLINQLRKKVEATASFFQSGIEAGGFIDKYSPMQMALIFHQLFDLNIKFQFFNIEMLPPEDCYETIYNLFTQKS